MRAIAETTFPADRSMTFFSTSALTNRHSFRFAPADVFVKFCHRRSIPLGPHDMTHGSQLVLLRGVKPEAAIAKDSHFRRTCERRPRLQRRRTAVWFYCAGGLCDGHLKYRDSRAGPLGTRHDLYHGYLDELYQKAFFTFTRTAQFGSTRSVDVSQERSVGDGRLAGHLRHRRHHRSAHGEPLGALIHFVALRGHGDRHLHSSGFLLTPFRCAARQRPGSRHS